MLILLLGACRPAPVELQSEVLDETPRILVMSAFDAETPALIQRAEETITVTAVGRNFTLSQLGGKDVVIAQSGVSLVHAAMTTQVAVDHFNLSAIIFSGIAGGVNPALHIGDVVVPAEWGQHMERVFARQKGADWDPRNLQIGLWKLWNDLSAAGGSTSAELQWYGL